MGVNVRKKGAVADGSAVKKISAAVEDLNEDVGQTVHNAVKARLSQVLRNPSGYYESRVTTDVSDGAVVISDGGVVYGPWLEGTSSRNGRSRFKGYGTFLKISQEIEKKALSDAESSLDLGRLS